MNAVWLLWAETQNPLHAMGRHFREGGAKFEPGDVAIWLSVILALMALVAYAAHRFDRRAKPGYRNSRRLFGELCRAHGLDRPKRRLLAQLARRQALAEPARLFLEPERFDTARLGGGLSAHRDELMRLRDNIFGKRLRTQL